MSLVVSIDGACRENGTPTARASWAVFFGPGFRFNSSGRLSPSCPQTSPRAEIEALSQAIDAIRGISIGDLTLQEIKIRSDSEYLCQAMSMWVEGWVEDDGLRPDGQSVAHFDRLDEIHGALDEMTYGENGGLQFQFWHVPRGENREADALANSALDEGANFISAPREEQCLVWMDLGIFARDYRCQGPGITTRQWQPATAGPFNPSLCVLDKEQPRYAEATPLRISISVK